MKRFVVGTMAVFVLAFVMAGSLRVQADNIAWTEPAGGSFQDDGNWDGDVPVVGDSAIFSLNSDYTVTFAGAAATDHLFVADGGVSFNLGGFTYGINALSMTTADTTLGLTLLNGTVTASGATSTYVGDSTGVQSTLTVGAGGLFQWKPPGAAGTFHIGRQGEGTVSLVAGGRVSTTGTRDVQLGGQANGVGTVTVDGSGSLFTFVGVAFRVGIAGEGHVGISNGGVLNATAGTGGLLLGDANGSSGTLTVTGDGSALQMGARQVLIGGSTGSTGAATVSDGGAISSTSTWYVGMNGTGSLAVEDTGSLVTASLYRVGGSAAVDGGSGSITVRDGGEVRGGVSVGYRGDGELRIESGGTWGWMGSAITTSYIGDLSGSTGTLTVTGAGSTLLLGGHMNHGHNGGVGHMTVSDGGVATFKNIRNVAVYYLGSVGEASTLTVTGADSLMHIDHTADTRFGSGTNMLAEVLVEQGGQIVVGGIAGDDVTAGSNLLVSAGTGSQTQVRVTGTGSRLDVGAVLRVGTSGLATLSVDTGGGAWAGGGIEVGVTAAASGNNTVTVDGAGSRLKTEGHLQVGMAGRGILVVENGGVVDVAGLFYSGASTGSTSAVTVRGADAELQLGGEAHIGSYGSSITRIEDGGRIVADGGSDVIFARFAAGSGHMTVTGTGSRLDITGLLRVGDNGYGTLTLENAGQAEVSGTVRVGQSAVNANDNTILVTGTGSRLDVKTPDGNMMVGVLGRGLLTLESGGVVDVAAYLYIGDTGGSTGIVTVHGENSLLRTGNEIMVSRLGTGTLNVEAGGRVEVTGTAGHVRLGRSAGGGGTLTVTGAGSRLDASEALNVGEVADGTMTVSDGGIATAKYGRIGYRVNSTGLLTVTGNGSRLETASYLHVGVEAHTAGSGTLLVSAGGTAEVGTDLFVGNAAGSLGAVTVTGAGSLLNSGTADIGRSGAGSLTVSAGGRATPSSMVIARNAGSTGAVTVTGAGSELAAGNWIGIGAQASGDEWLEQTGGTGAMTLADGGVVSAAGRFYIHNGGTLNLRGGRVTGSTFMMRDGSALDVELDAPNLPAMIAISGQARIYGGELRIGLSGDFVFTEGDTYRLLSYGTLGDAGEFNVFDGWADNTVYDIGGYDFLFRYDNDSAITLMAIPEPGSLGLLLGAGALVALARRWHNRG